MQTPLSYCFHSGLYYLPQVLSYFLSYHKKAKITICLSACPKNNHSRLPFTLKFLPTFKLAHHRHNIGTVLLFPRKGRSCRSPAAILKNEHGDVNYFSTVVFIFIAVLLLAFILNLFSIISTKQELDHCADQMVKQIQLSGGINGETDQLFQFLCSQIEGAENISYSIDASYKSPTPSGMSRAIQLGTPFYITITGRAKLGGFWNFNLVNITVVSRGAGVSEHYWK